MVTENGIQSDGNTSFLRAARAGNLDKVLEHLKNNVDINTCNANGLNALHLASKDGHVHIVSELLKRGAAVDNATKKGNTALHIASLAGQEEVVKLLLQYNASVNAQSQNGFSPLYMAAQENHDSVVKLLLSNGANQSLATEDGFTPLLVAMQQGHDKVVAVLLESDTRGKVRLPALHIAAKKDDVRAATLLLENDHNPDVTSKSGFTPLHIASHYGNEAIANLLIQKNADVNFPAKHNITPLHVSCKWGKANMVSLLLEKGAAIESKTRDGLTPLHCASRSGHEQVVDMLLERGAPISAKTKNGLAPLHMAAQGEHVDAARILLYHRAPVDEVTVDYLTALHVASHCGHVRVAKLLLDRNADANARALNGFTPLHIACKKNRIKVVELLLKHGASISATTESGLTPLHVASFMGCMNIVIYLLQHEASPDVPTVRGETPLHLACRANQTDIIRILLRNGAQVDARAREQQTALHIASRLGNVDIVMLLLQHGAQVDATTKDMYTALHIAAKEGQDEVAAVLIENGASLEASTKKGFQPMHLAAKYGHMKVAELLLQKGAPVDAQGKNGVTPLHVASHYDNQNVALLLLNKGASPHATAKNGHTPLHIAARKNQMDIATTLLEYGAHADSESRAGFSPLHLSSQEGHIEMSNLLLEHKANANHQAKNGLTPLHLCAQEDRTNVGQILVDNSANVNTKTKQNYTPLHMASHFGQLNMVRFLLQNGADVNADTAIGYTPLHQAAQQGHLHIVNVLLENKADPDAVTSQGQTPLYISQKLGYISVVESLKNVTQPPKDPMQTSVNEGEKYRVVAPEAMHETFMSDSEEEGGDDANTDHPYRYLTVDEMKSLGDDSLPIDVTRDERVDSNRMAASTDSCNMNVSQNEDTITPQHVTETHAALDGRYAIDNIKIERHPEQIGFLVSFLVDARGGAMRGCRHSGIRIIVPPRSAAQPTRITCRYVKPQRTLHPPQLMEGEALASRVLELGPVAAKFIGPVIMEVPHFASLRGKEREIVILRSDNGETWREHQVENSDEIIHDTLNEYFEPGDINQMDESSGGRICRFVTYDFPQYFAVVSRIRQEVHAIGPEGGMVSSTVVPQVQAVFPQGALTKKIKVGLQAQPIDPDLTAKLLGRGVAVSPIVTVEPRRRKFHKAITLSMPAPKAHSQGMINQYSGNAPTLRLLCSITGGPSRAQWEDVTGSTPLTFVNDCVSFTTTVSARFWLMDCRNISEATKMATDLYREAIHVPFMAKFVVFAKRVEPLEARLRVFCMTDDKEDKTLEYQEHFTEVAKSRDVEVLEGKPQYTEFAGNLVPVTKSGEQLHIQFKAFRENRLPFNVRVKDQHADTVGRALFMREPRVAKGEQPQQPICILNIVLPEQIYAESAEESRDLKHFTELSSFYRTGIDRTNLSDIRIVDISNLLGEDWLRLAPELGLTEQEISDIIAENPTSTPRQAQSMLQNYILRKDSNRTVLETSLRSIKRDDIIKKCLRLSSFMERPKQVSASARKGTSLDNGFEETDIMKDSESVEELAAREREELKYSAEEKIVEDSDGEEEEEEEVVKRSVAERREQITKRLSIERPIPASTQQKEIVQEVAEIKRRSLIEDKKAMHEEEIIMQAPTDNIIKSATIPEPVIKLKSAKKEEVDVSKSDFDKELQDKFKTTIKDVDSFEHKASDEFIASAPPRLDEKVQLDSVVTEKPFKQDTDTFVVSTTKTETIKHEIPEQTTHEQIEVTKKFLEQEHFDGPVSQEQEHFEQPKSEKHETITTTTTETTTSTKNFLDSEIAAQSEPTTTVTKKVVEEQDGPVKTITTTTTTTVNREWTEPIEVEMSGSPGNVQTTVRITKDVLSSDNEDEFYKTIQEKITKKMSQDFTALKDDIIADVSDEILVSQTPPPTPNDANQHPEEIRERLHYEEATKKPKQHDDDYDDSASTKESRSHIAPKPTPRSSKPIGSTDATTKTIGPDHTAQTDTDNESNTTVDRSSGDFSETKKFWQSIESSSHGSIDEQQMPPVPKPRSQSQSLSQAPSIPQVSDDFDSIEKTNISLIEESQSVSQSVSQSSSVKISSEAQVERSESSSLKSKHDIIHDDDSITDRLENESFPHSERIDLDPYEAKLDSLEYDTTERSTSSIYKVKERENILDDDDDGTDYEGKASAAFYIGESSGNIITKSSTEKRSELEHDNDGSEAKESTQFDEQPTQTEQKKDNIESDEGHSSKRDSQHEVRFKLEPEEIGVAAYGKDDDFVSKLERVPTGLDKSLEEKCDTELPEKIIHESPIPSDYKQDEEALGSELSFSSGGIVESHVEITELSSASESIVEKSKLPSDEEPVVKFPSETIIEDDHHVKIEQLDLFDMTPATEPHRAAVIHSPVEAKSVIEEFEYSVPLDTNVYKHEISEYIESQTTDILQPTTVTETTLIQPSAESFEYDTLVESKTAPVVHSPIQAKEFTVKSEFDDYAIETQQSTAPVKHSPVQSSFEIYASETSVKTEQLPKEKLIDDFSFDFDKPKVAAVVHSPIESSKSDVKEEFKETVGAKSEPIDDFSFDFDKPKFAPVGYSPVESAKQDQQIKEESFEHFETQAAKPKQTIEDTVFSSKTEIIDDYSLEFDKPKTAPVEHSPIETSKSDVKDEFKETVGAKSEPIDDFSFDLEKPKPTPVLHSPVESVKQEQQIETVSVEHFDIRTEEPKQPIEETAISGKAKLIDDNSWEFDKPKMAPVLHSPIESTKLEQPLKEQITETLSTKSEVDDFSFDFDKPKSAPVVHSPVENVKQEQQLEKVTFEHFEVRTDEPKQPIEDTTFSGKADIIDDYSWEFGKPKAAPVLHSPIETSKPDVKEELKESVASKFEQIDDFSFDFDKPKSAPVLHSPIETSKQELSEKFETRVDDLSQKQADESSLSTGSKSEVVHRMGGSKVGPKNRWSTTDPDHSSPSSHNESLENSRPCSSDVENLYLSYPNSSAEYQTALDASSLVPGSTEYHTAVSTFDHSGKTISSQESMKSLDSESSGNLGSVEVSEASETLVPSELDFDETEQRLSSLDTFGDNILEESILDYEPADIASNMKRSHEMIFAQKAGTVQSLEYLSSVEKSELSERKGSDEEFKTQSEVGSDDTKFGTSLTDGSVLSMSFSTTSNDPDTIVENIQDDMASSYGAGSLVGSYETKMMLHDESTSFDEKMPLEPIDNLIMTTSTVTEDNVTSVNTQITSDAQSGEEATPRRGRHKRNDSTSFIAGLDMAKLSQESTDSSSLDEEMVIHDVPEDDRKESGSDSDYDRYETEYSRSFKKPGVQRKKKSMSPKSAQKPEPEQLERKKSIPSIETIVEVSEDIAETEKLRSRGTSQNMLDYSQIPDITITDDPTKYVSDDEDFEQQKQEPEPEIVAVEQVEAKPESPPKSARVPKPKEPKISHEEYEKLIERQYKTKENEFEEPKADSPTSDSFELVEQPDISDEFVIIEEVAKEAHELMTEGKSVSIQQTKYMKKHDDDVEKIIIKSAPAATNEGSTLLQGRHDLAFEFEESPSSGANTESSEEGGNGLESSRKWVEMQLAEQAQNLRYPYEVDRGMLEDIKEEDTDFEIGSSRISSFKDSYSSNDFEAAAARRYQSKEHDNISVNSLQEFERLEQAISLENRKFHSSSNDSFSNGSFPKRGLRTAQADEISLSSLQDFEGLENACLEHTLLELKAKEEHALLLSRSDDSNKSDGATKVTEKMIVTKAEPPKTSVDSTGQFTTTQTVMTKIITETRSKALELDDDFSSSNLMEVSTDSLEAKHQKQSMHGKNTSQHGSSDSLEISKSADVMTSSIDSIEISKDCATGKSSKSDCDSIEQIARGDKRDSIDSIDAQYAAMTQSIHIQRDSFDANLLDLTSSGIMGGSCITDTKTITTTSVASSSGYGGGISKDISSDSLNLNQEPELLITSTESLDHTSSTFATYQSQTDSQMTMSGSMTSCDSNTLVDSYETQYQTGTAANLLPDDKFGARMTSTTVTTTTAYKTKSSSSDVDKS